MSIFITGDTHGDKKIGFNSVDGYMPRLNTENFPEQKSMTKNDYVIICGDFGGIWDFTKTCAGESKAEKYSLNWLDNKPFTTLFVPGNHENYDRLTGIRDQDALDSWLFAKIPEEDKKMLRTGYPRKQWHGGYIREIRPSVFMLEPGVFDIDGKKIFAYGGAPSHDISSGILHPTDYSTEKEFLSIYKKWDNEGRSFRVEHVSWWPQEIPDIDAENTAKDALTSVGNQVDLIITHDCPRSVREQFDYHDDILPMHEFLEYIYRNITFRHWFFGHFHDNRNLSGDRVHMIYEQIIEFK